MAMHRKTCERFNTPGGAHELTFSCFRRRKFLSRDRTLGYLAESIIQAKEQHQFHVWAYVFMPEHVHLLLWPVLEEYFIEDILKSIKLPVARKAVAYLRTNNPKGLLQLATGQKHAPYRFWQAGGGYDRNLHSREAIKSAIDYLHNNPVRRELAAYPEDWPWSSAADWAGMGPGPVPLDKDFPSSL
jgi:putative transposase